MAKKKQSQIDFEEQKKLSSWCYQKFKDAMLAKQQTTEDWFKYLNAYNNDLYTNNNVPDYKSNYCNNLIYYDKPADSQHQIHLQSNHILRKC